ncbi:hypothetical protein V511_12195 [Mesotoga sp. Brook.08.YT.4.2.5.1]|uniref:RecB family exonuclease n=1 Tax=unclassified Mesotoga TaxID=1184398 RepID=UPI000C4D3909|nr:MULTISPECIES: PD-(D/E)XK nuclease family protein [unclassified Mesotoga]PNE19880.1 hypothetical protein V511_12195 [Mesotoga sp. Brook.08.YT.4.2.5.1]PVD18213.1 hypothetical protein V512_015210 [Mesotoga sp. Brook.08.105.5.1]RDI93693.1 hypothetical protein Q502_04375 [Mesotoga sp. Brook.08.YT.4.2.5.2.]
MLDHLLPLSGSRIDTYLRCPRRFYIDRVLGEKAPETPAMILGKAVHEALEIWVKTGDNEKALEKIDFIDDYETAFRRFTSGKSLLKGFNPRALELKFGLTKELNPTGFDSEDCFFRGIIDLVCKNDSGFEVYDYKSGWSRPDPRQIFAYSMALNRFDKDVNKAGFILLASLEVIDFFIGEDELEAQPGFYSWSITSLTRRKPKMTFLRTSRPAGTALSERCVLTTETTSRRRSRTLS